MERSGRADDGGMTNNKQIVEQFITALFTDGDLTAVDRYLDPHFINHDPPLPSSPDGPEGMRQAAEIFRSAFPDWRSDQQHIIAEGDLVAEHFVAPWHPPLLRDGESPTGRDVVLRGVNIFRIANGKITERWGRLDDLGLLQQLGLAAQPMAAESRSLPVALVGHSSSLGVAPGSSRSVAVVGGGFGGVGAAVMLQRAGYENVTVPQRGERVGGVWHHNTYPGRRATYPPISTSSPSPLTHGGRAGTRRSPRSRPTSRRSPEISAYSIGSVPAPRWSARTGRMPATRG